MSKTHKDNKYQSSRKSKSDRRVYYDRKNRRQFKDAWKQIDWGFEEERDFEEDYE